MFCGEMRYLLFCVVVIWLFAGCCASCSVNNGGVNCKCPTDPEPWRNSRNGANVLKLIENDLTSGTTGVESVRIYGCGVRKLELDLNYFRDAKKIEIADSQPLNIRLIGDINSGDKMVEFRNIQGVNDWMGVKGSLVIGGGVNWCQKSCQNNPRQAEQTGPPSSWDTCNQCVPSNLKLNFYDVEHVLLHSFGGASYKLYDDEGHTVLHGSGIKTFSVDEPMLSGVKVDSLTAHDGCYLEGEKVECQDLQDDEDSYSSSLYVVIAIVASLTIVGTILLFGFCRAMSRARAARAENA